MPRTRRAGRARSARARPRCPSSGFRPAASRSGIPSAARSGSVLLRFVLSRSPASSGWSISSHCSSRGAGPAGSRPCSRNMPAEQTICPLAMSSSQLPICRLRSIIHQFHHLGQAGRREHALGGLGGGAEALHLSVLVVHRRPREGEPARGWLGRSASATGMSSKCAPRRARRRQASVRNRRDLGPQGLERLAQPLRMLVAQDGDVAVVVDRDQLRPQARYIGWRDCSSSCTRCAGSGASQPEPPAA